MRLIIVAIFFFQSISAQNLKPIIEIESGYYSYSSSFSTKGGSNITSDIGKYPLYTNLLIGCKFKAFTFNQNVENWFGYKDGFSFNPYQIRYITGITYKVKKFVFAYEHMCFHPVIASSTYQFEHLFFASHDKLTVKFTIL